MSESANAPQLLLRVGLKSLPALDLPGAVVIRPFGGGDEEVWNNIIEKSFGQRYDFDSFMRNDPAFNAENILLAEVDGIPAATASAWCRDEFGTDTGYIHMVGCLPEFRGMRLGYWVSLAAMHKMRENGRANAVLHTDDFRIAAIKTYLRLGFEIDFTVHESIPQRWQKIEAALGDK